LNSTLIDAATNVQVRFKSSPFGSRSHGLDPQNSFTFTAYGEPLLVNNTYRDLYGSPFHKGWCWTTKAHNAVLVNGEGQKSRSPDPGCRIVSSSFQDGLDHVVGDGTASYEGKLRRALRHVLFIKPDLAIIVDDLEASRPSTFQWMLHGLNPFKIDDQAARLERNDAGVLVDYVSSQPLTLRQWTGYDPAPDARYLASINHPGIPEQWHLEAATSSPAERSFTLTVLRPFRRDQTPASKIKVEQNDTTVLLRVHGTDDSETTVALRKPDAPKAVIGSLSFNDFALVRRAAREWRVKTE
jgi:Heparinase II/III-like protein